jgi:orotidine-5'-phosphate decarboxylase
MPAPNRPEASPTVTDPNDELELDHPPEKRPPFFEQLAARCEATGSSLCIGLDPDPRRIPKYLGSGPEAIFNFCAEIVAATADSAAAFKPNVAFFESIGVEGMHVLDQIVRLVPDGIPVILDAKRGDIDSTAAHYARALFDGLRAGAVTVNPYMGHDSLVPFLERKDRGVYILCLTSNPGAREFQLHDDLYLRVARKVVDWNKDGNCGLVVGATKPQYLSSILSVAPDVPLLIPGLGTQGGDLETIMHTAPGLPLHRLLFNVSRSIIFASNDNTFVHQARVAARYYANRIQNAREKTLAGMESSASEAMGSEPTPSESAVGKALDDTVT